MQAHRAAFLASALWRRLIPPRCPPAVPSGPRPLFGREATVALHRDSCGVPTVEAGSLPDLGYGLGVAMAEDRLWQMETMRRLAAGRLAEILGDRPLPAGRMGSFGGSLLAVDRFYRSLRMFPVARQELSLLAPEALSLLAGFSDGVNAWLTQCPPGRLPPECLLLGVRPEPWRPEDSLAIGKLFGWLLSLAFPAKPVLARLQAAPDLHWLLPPGRSGRPTVLDEAIPVRPADLDRTAREALGLSGPGQGSNNWALHGSRTASGKPILCNDPHLLLDLPPIWYPVMASAPGIRVTGGALSGVPLPLVGRNPDLAWGCTAVLLDDGDYYRETLDASKASVRRAGRWEAIEAEEETFRVRGRREAVRHLIRYVRHEGVRCPLLEVPPETAAVSYRWVGFEPWPTLEAFLGAARARGVAEFESAISRFALPAQNVVVADVAGHIAYYCAGRIPRRPSARGDRLFLDGADPDDAWHGYLRWEEQPRALDPPGGFLATANNRLRADLPPTLAGGFWEPPYRAARLSGVLADCRDATAEEMAGLQADVLSLQAVGLVSTLIRPVSGLLRDPEAVRASALLLAWDGRMEAGSAAAALYQLFYRALLVEGIRPGLERREPGLFARYLSLLHLAVPAVDRALAEGDPRCFPRGVAAGVEACLATAWREAVRRLGADPACWRWGRLHRLTFRHILGRGDAWPARLLAWLLRLNRGPYPRGGDGMTVNLGAFSLGESFAIQVGPSYRQIVDLGRPEEARWIVAGGVSGDPRSACYDDQIGLWLSGAYRPMRLPRDCAGLPPVL